MGRSSCVVCEHDDRDALEQIGLQALNGPMSWREAGRQTDRPPDSIRAHMERHYIPPMAAAAGTIESELAGLLIESVSDLVQQAHAAPPEVKPLYLIAIKELQDLMESGIASRKLVVATLKTIQEMTGMRNEQQVLLGYARALEERTARQAALPPGLPVIDVEEVESE